MVKPQLTVALLTASGFDEIGCWELNDAGDLAHTIALPKQAGVYAFGINGIVYYVGLASRSLRQRLNFYRKPGASQTTNIRLNEIIRGNIGKGAVVRILVSHPPDHQWKGLRISGAEGLEAGLIADFDLPWNMRGSQASPASDRTPSQLAQTDRTSGAAQQVAELIERRPGMTELEIAKAIHGPSAVQQRVNAHCRLLVGWGLIERRGGGGHSDPFVYYPFAKDDA